MDELRPCSRCARHVRQRACPFCGAISSPPPRVRSMVRGATRAAVFYLGATLAGCEGQERDPAPVYGGPPLPEQESLEPPEEGPSVPEEQGVQPPDPIDDGPPEAPPEEAEEPPAIAPPYGAPALDELL